MGALVLYHGGGCRDGFGSAYVMHARFPTNLEIVYRPIQYGDSLPPEIESGAFSEIYMLDFSVDCETILRIRASCERITILDHHKTAIETLSDMGGRGPKFIPGVSVILDSTQSGAVLTWNYFHNDEPVPRLLAYVQDRDLWLHRLPESREINAWIRSHPMDFATWDWMAAELESDSGFGDAYREGGAILRTQTSQVDMIARKAVLTKFDDGDYLVPVVNSCIHQSEIAERMLADHPDSPFAVVFFCKTWISENKGDESEIVVSLRSRASEPGGGFDCAAYAQGFPGGGGHRNAAGFTFRSR
jgi:uncharacterized protein